MSKSELSTAITSLGVRMTDAELKELFVEMDTEMNGTVSLDEFTTWWKDSIGNSSVEIIHTMEAGVFQSYSFTRWLTRSN